MEPSTVISDLSTLPLNSKGYIQFAASVSPTGAALGASYICVGDNTAKTIYATRPSTNAIYVNSCFDNVWSGWEELMHGNLTWTKILDSAIFTETGNVTIPSIANYKELLVIVDTRRASNNQPFGYSNSLHLPAFLYGNNSVTFAIPLAVGDFVKFLFTSSTLYVTEFGTLPATANAYIVSIYAR